MSNILTFPKKTLTAGSYGAGNVCLFVQEVNTPARAKIFSAQAYL